MEDLIIEGTVIIFLILSIVVLVCLYCQLIYDLTAVHFGLGTPQGRPQGRRQFRYPVQQRQNRRNRTFVVAEPVFPMNRRDE